MIQSSKRLYILLGVAAVLLLVAVVLPKVLYGGGGEDPGVDLSAPMVPAGASPGTPAAPAAPVATSGEAAAPVETFEVFTTKNPFTPLVASEPIVETTTTPVVTDETATGGAVPTTPVTSSPAPTPTPIPAATTAGASGGSATAPRPQQRVAVLEVFLDAAGAPRASVRVNDTVYDVAQGDRFATSYQVVELADDEGCGQFLFSDDRFRVCEGEELLK